ATATARSLSVVASPRDRPEHHHAVHGITAPPTGASVEYQPDTGCWRAAADQLSGNERLDFDAFADAPPHDER
ncbi:MAG TPA: hypothetical protein VD866_19545, partial [Urbifossiella sp.]|nr:hypothetical protein [Urbifossiella sp.]